MIAGLTAGCSSGVARFGNIDNVFTASTNNQRTIIGDKQQPFPAIAPRHAAELLQFRSPHRG